MTGELTWTDTAWKRAVSLCKQMEREGYKPEFPSEGMRLVDEWLYSDKECVRCGTWMPLFPFCKENGMGGYKYVPFIVCIGCGRVERVGGGE